MQHPLKTRLFITSTLLFVLHQLAQKLGHRSIPIADAYLDNLVAMPIMLSLLVAERRFLFRSGQNYVLSGLETWLATAYIGLLAEFVFPLFSTRFTYDPFDFPCYAIGTGFFLLSEHNRRQTGNQHR